MLSRANQSRTHPTAGIPPLILGHRQQRRRDQEVDGPIAGEAADGIGERLPGPLVTIRRMRKCGPARARWPLLSTCGYVHGGRSRWRNPREQQRRKWDDVAVRV